jgi:hypothetical protein
MVIIGPVTRKIWTVCSPKSSWPAEKRPLPLTSHIGGGSYGPTAVTRNDACFPTSAQYFVFTPATAPTPET